ncbi:MAG: thymidine phosphorylase [Gemmatimonadetes bacterium]|nr:thymidine phosphorylase [Gemmatimonadota bacterium]
MIPARVIEAKRDGRALSRGEMETFFQAYLRGDVADEQVAALLMAVFFRGMEPEELDALTRIMLESGDRLDLGDLDGPRVDKHSTGGVGDKVSLALAPLAAELGIYVPMMSGRGLGHTGGTLDKLEAIPGFRTDLSLDEFRRVLGDVGCAMIGQTPEIAPLDGRLYALRSATGTVPSLPLIASSIMSKKLAEGLTGLVLDVKLGEGAFLAGEDLAFDLARTMVRLGEAHGVRTVALTTAMDRPLGRAVGNALEVAEAVACLRGGGPDDLRTVVVALAAEMAMVAGPWTEREAAAERAASALDDGSALERFGRLVAAQGGDTDVVDRPGRSLASAPETAVLEAARSGVVEAVAPKVLGWAVVERLG